MNNMPVPKLRFKDENGKEYPEWKENRLGNIANFIRGLSYKKEEVTTNNNDFLVIRSSNITEDNVINYTHDLQFVSKNCSNEQLLVKGDIVICLANGSERLVGKSAWYDGKYKGKITFGAFCGVLRSKNPICKYLIQTSFYRNYISKIKQGGNGALANLYGKDLLHIKCSIPSLPEQEKIADFLSTYDRMIDVQSQRVEVMKTRKEGLLQKIFSQEIRFKDAQGKNYPEWKLTLLSDVATFHTGLTYHPEDVTNNGSGVLVLRSSNIQGGNLTYTDNVYVKNSVSKIQYLKLHDIIMCIRNGSKSLVGKNAIAENDDLGNTWGAFMMVIRAKCNYNFLHQYLNSSLFKKEIYKDSGTATVNQITSGMLKKCELLVPCNMEQQKIGKFFSAVDAQIEVEEKRLETMKTIKKGLLQQMFI